MIGKTISHYKILKKIGEGGMGVVYKAQDTKLGRVVALKFLPSHALGTGDEQSRFSREAQAAAALNHSNIATIHEIDEFNGQSFIAMEYIDGCTLKDKINQGPLKLDQAIKITIQVGDGLHVAHEKGIVHRDIKPANIMLTEKGEAKITDFGLAKLTDRTKLTKSETILGTVAYMSPEQTQGTKVDRRSDIFSLGGVLYEMITGQSPFAGDYDQAMVYSILNEEPEPITGLRTGVPMELERIVNKTLAKSPDERYQHLDEMRVDLVALQKDLPSTLKPSARFPKTQRTGRWRQMLPWSLVLLASTLAILFFLRNPSRNDLVTQRFTLSTDPLVLGDHPASPVVALSPNGTKLVYVADRDGKQHLFLRDLNSYEASLLPGTQNGHGPFFSPDGEWLAFVADDKLKKMPVRGGPSLTLCEAPGFHKGSWGEDDLIAISMEIGNGIVIVKVPAAGGKVEILTRVDNSKGEMFHAYPELLPGNKTLLFTSLDAGGRSPKIWALSMETNAWHLVLDGGNARYVQTGHLVYPLGGSLWAVPFNPDRVEVTGNPTIVAEGIMMGFPLEPSIGHYDISMNGTLVYLAGHTSAGNLLVWVDRHGISQPISKTPRYAWGPRLSPDGKKVAVRIPDTMGDMQVWVYDLTREFFTQLTTRGKNWWPVWASDGKRIAFPSINPNSGRVDIYSILSDGSASPELLVSSKDFDQQPFSWSRDGKLLLFHRQTKPPNAWDILVKPVDPDQEPWPFLATEANEFHPALSPDGHWLAYVSDRLGEPFNTEVYVQSFPERGPRWQISHGGGFAPTWSPDGKELFFEKGSFRGETHKMMVVNWVTEPEVLPSQPRILFEGDYKASLEYGRNYDISRNGQRFLMLKPSTESNKATQLNVAINWFEELKRFVPSGN
jgi:serine/threonine-protein kinase